MPGLVAFRRRWRIGSDDLIIPALFHLTINLIWAIILITTVNITKFNTQFQCIILLKVLILGYLVILGTIIITEICICVVALKGTILDTKRRRSSMKYFLCCRFVILFVECGWSTATIAWFANFYLTCPINEPKEIVLGMVICNLCMILSILLTIWCSYDSSGRSWVKMKQHNPSETTSESWREKIYEESWKQRFQFRFCCISYADKKDRYTFTDAAHLFSQFFRDLDVVPSDMIAGLILLREFQKNNQSKLIDNYELFLSGVRIKATSKFLNTSEKDDLEILDNLKYYFYYAARAYVAINDGTTSTCAPCRNNSIAEHPQNVKEKNGEIEIIFATSHVDVNETPFFVAVDYEKKKIVIGIRGTSSIKDVLTDLNAESEILPLDQPRDDFFGHRGMVQAAHYIFQQLQNEKLLEKAHQLNHSKETSNFGLVIVGHSLGAGIASVLGILLRQTYENLECFCFSPPGGLLSEPAVECTKKFAISVVVGKDVVIRSGLNQMETLRKDLIRVIEKTDESKWKIICCNEGCCGYSRQTSFVQFSKKSAQIQNFSIDLKDLTHPALYPPGRIIHLVRSHSTERKATENSGYYALWAQNTDFDEVLISSSMIGDHKTSTVLKALNNVGQYSPDAGES